MSVAHELEQELKRALSASPSPGFEARVLRRIAGDPPGAGWRGLPARRGIAGLLALAASLGTAVVVYQAAQGLSDTPPVAPPERLIVQRVPALALEVPPIPEFRLRPVAPIRVTPTSRRSADPEVIVPPSQMNAIRRLVRAVNEGRVPPIQDAVDTHTGPPLDLIVAPLVVEPIGVPAADTFDGHHPFRSHQ